jgi:hypothetical protein
MHCAAVLQIASSRALKLVPHDDALSIAELVQRRYHEIRQILPVLALVLEE